MDFEALKQKIEEATKMAFTEMVEKNGHEEIYSFALYSDEGAMTVCPSTNTLEHLSDADPDDFDYYKFEPCEWKYEMIGADKEFSSISKIVREYVLSIEDDSTFETFQQQLYNTCIAVLEKLKNEDFFKTVTGKDIFLLFSVSEYEFEKDELEKIIIRLNDNSYRDEYLDWMKSWGN